MVAGSAAGVRFEQPVELAPHEDAKWSSLPRQFPQLHIRNPRLWWPRQMGEPHLERLTMSFSVQGKATDEQSVDFGFASHIRTHGQRQPSLPCERQAHSDSWRRMVEDMLLRTDDNRLRDQFRLVRDLNLNTIRLEGKLETDEFFHLQISKASW